MLTPYLSLKAQMQTPLRKITPTMLIANHAASIKAVNMTYFLICLKLWNLVLTFQTMVGIATMANIRMTDMMSFPVLVPRNPNAKRVRTISATSINIIQKVKLVRKLTKLKLLVLGQVYIATFQCFNYEQFTADCYDYLADQS